MKFTELNLHPELHSAIEKIGYQDCTPIQEQAAQPIIDGRDVAGLAQTGTGKTAAFLIPLMERILRARPVQGEVNEETKALIEKRAFADWKSNNFILILVPTRELAEQVHENIQKLSEFSGLKGFAIYGGTGYDKQKEALSSGLDFIVATPGRLIDLYKEHLVDLKQVRAIVFDEADRMFDMGFKDDMKFILQRSPEKRQFLVFSATLNFEVLTTAYQYGAEPVEINISRDQTKADNVKDQIFHVGGDEKPQHLLSLLKLHAPKQAIIFSNFKMNVERIAKFLTDNGFPAMAISSLLTQAQRNKVIESFKAENQMNILVATDVAARGLDIKGVDMVINYEMPQDAESYVHRIGRTGRAGAEGKAFSLVGDKDVESLSRVEDYVKTKLEIGFLENDQLITEFKPFPREERYGGGDRKFDRGPRQEGRGGGGRREGGRDDRRGSRRDGGRDGGREGGRDDRRHSRGGDRPEGRSQQERRPQQGASSARPEHKRHDSKPQGGQHTQGSKPQHKHGQRPQHAAKGPHKGKHVKQAYQAHSKKQQSLGQKITGFFKKLFGS